RLDLTERQVLADAVSDVIDLLGGADDDGDDHDGRAADAPGAHPLDRLRLGGEPLDAPQDPALLRLLPDAYRDAPDGAAEFRRLTEADLRASKTEHLRLLRAALQASGA